MLEFLTPPPTIAALHPPPISTAGTQISREITCNVLPLRRGKRDVASFVLRRRREDVAAAAAAAAARQM